MKRNAWLQEIQAFVFNLLCSGSLALCLIFLGLVIFSVVKMGIAHLDFQFLSDFPSRHAHKAGVYPAVLGTFYLMILTALISVPLAVATAIYLEEYAKDGRFVRLMKINLQTLSGVPAIIYGILGLTLFVRTLHCGRSLLAGALTMALLILPMITIAAQEAIRAVPKSFRMAGFGMGLTRWHVVSKIVVPAAMPGILTGIILGLSRAIGEAAPLILVGALNFVAFVPQHPFDGFTILSIQIYNWASRPQEAFHEIAATAILVLLVILLVLNSAAILLRMQYGRQLSQMNR